MVEAYMSDDSDTSIIALPTITLPHDPPIIETETDIEKTVQHTLLGTVCTNQQTWAGTKILSC